MNPPLNKKSNITTLPLLVSFYFLNKQFIAFHFHDLYQCARHDIIAKAHHVDTFAVDDDSSRRAQRCYDLSTFTKILRVILGTCITVAVLLFLP